MKSVFFLPTNRSIEKCVKSYILEVNYAKEKLQCDIPLVIVETNKESFTEENKKIIIELQKQYKDLEMIHLTVEDQKKYFEKLFEDMDPEIKEIFEETETNYGTAMNKLGLFTCSLGGDAFHRRDSDTRLCFSEFKEAEEKYPIEVEMNFLGKKVSELPSELTENKVQEGDIWVVGGNYFGEWNLDVKDFSREQIYKLYQLLGFEEDSIEEICAEAFQEQAEFFQRDDLSLVTSVNDGLNPDCGNVSVYRLFEELPNVPGKNTLAADYFMFDTATALGLPVIHHTREVFHEYHSDRFQMEKKKRYWYGIAKFADYFNLYMKIYNSKEFYNNNYGKSWDEIRENIIDIVQGFILEDVIKREERIKDIAQDVLRSGDEKYFPIADELQKNASKYIEESNKDYQRQILLLKNWKNIIKKAKKIELRDFVDQK